MLAAFDATFLAFTVSLFSFSAWSDWYNDFVRPELTPYWLPIIQVRKGLIVKTKGHQLKHCKNIFNSSRTQSYSNCMSKYVQ